MTDLASYAAQVFKVQRREFVELTALPRPPQSVKEAALLRQFLAAGEEIERDYGGLVSAARRNDSVAL